MKFVVLIYFWGLFGFALGTVILLGPVRWWASFCRERGFSDGFESGGVVTLIIILVAASMSLALWASTEWVRTRSITLKLILPLIALGLAYWAYSYWINPSSMESNMAEEQVASQHFTFGPFPDEPRLHELKKEGYTGVISLLHPAVVPFEPQLIAQEREAAKAAGIEMIHLPMLPWVSENRESLDRLREIAESGTGRYYIHCYLGEDRVNVARRIIETSVGGEVISGVDTRKSLDSKPFFERGEIYSLAEGVYLTPFPTDEELGSYFLGGQVSTVIALLDPSNPEEAGLIEHERELLGRSQVDYEVVPLSSRRYDPELIAGAVSKAKASRKPVVVHSFFPPSHRHGGLAQAFLQSYMSGKLPVPPQYFDESFAGGTPEVVAPNVVVGPRPEGGEWELLYRTGVRSMILAGGTLDDSSESEARSAGLDVNASDDVNAILDLLSEGGPYYVFGPFASEVAGRAASRFGPAVPAAKRHGS